jgi:catechol 2,3-dioxygenase-like lactoylglutathione lyase family enzyme
MPGVIPSLRFDDLAEAVAFYVDTLGFDVVRGSTRSPTGRGARPSSRSRTSPGTG